MIHKDQHSCSYFKDIPKSHERWILQLVRGETTKTQEDFVEEKIRERGQEERRERERIIGRTREKRWWKEARRSGGVGAGCYLSHHKAVITFSLPDRSLATLLVAPRSISG